MRYLIAALLAAILTGCTVYEDGSATAQVGPLTLTVDAMDSTGDGWHLDYRP